LRRYRNTSALTEILTANHGRLGAVVKGVFSKGVHAQQLRSQLQLATPLLVSLTGRSELKSVIHLEAVGGTMVAPAGSGNALYCVMYLNELLVRLLPAHFASPALFAAYQLALEQIAQQPGPEFALRHFELQLLESIGFGIDFHVDASGERAIQAEGHYRFAPEAGFVLQQQSGGGADEFAGADLLVIATGQLSGDAVMRAAKRLMRLAINHHLGGRPLNSRALFRPVSSD
jgi:DNA repair protein RecO (recombination protein O)